MGDTCYFEVLDLEARLPVHKGSRAAGDFVTVADVALAENLQAMRVRREMEALAQDSAEVADAAVGATAPI